MCLNNKTTPLLHKLCSFYELKAFANKEQSQNAPSKRKKKTENLLVKSQSDKGSYTFILLLAKSEADIMFKCTLMKSCKY
jgi:hypothetical protein